MLGSAAERAARIAVPPELRREDDAVSPAFEDLAEKPLARAVAVDVRRVEEGDPGRERGVDDVTRARVVDAPSEVVAAEADGRDGELRCAEVPVFDEATLPVDRLTGRTPTGFVPSGAMTELLPRSTSRGRPRSGVGTIVVLSLAAAFVAWVLIDRNETGAARPSTAETATASGMPRISTADGLSAVSGLRGEPLFWAGPRRGTVYEVTENGSGQVFVRYLPSGTELGSPQPDFLTVATYPRADAYAEIRAAARRPGAVEIALPGGLAVYDEAAPTSVYLAHRGSTQQVEVYSPSPLEARRLVESGRVRPVP